MSAYEGFYSIISYCRTRFDSDGLIVAKMATN